MALNGHIYLNYLKYLNDLNPGLAVSDPALHGGGDKVSGWHRMPERRCIRAGRSSDPMSLDHLDQRGDHRHVLGAPVGSWVIREADGVSGAVSVHTTVSVGTFVGTLLSTRVVCRLADHLNSST
jgi:hypothetical protein